MATLVANNPYDVTQQKFAGTGDVVGSITGGARNGTNWDFMDQQGKVLTSVPYQDYVDNYQATSGAVRDGITSVNGVPVYNFSGQPAVNNSQPSSGLIGSALAPAAPAAPGSAAAPVSASAAGQPQAFTPTTTSVNRATETSAGQVESLLSKDSPLMQRARALATQQMAQRGLVNSSMSQGAGVAAMIDKITPIAQQDASTYAARTLANQDATNTAGIFNAGEANKFSLQTAQQNFTAAQNNLDRAQQVVLADKSIAAQKDLQNAQQAFQGAQAALDRTMQADLQKAQQTFTSAQAQLDRAQQTALADKSISAQQALQAAQQVFTSAQSELDRAQQTTIANAQIDAQKSLQQTQQQFASTQAQLDRDNQKSLMTLQDSINDANVSASFAATTAQNTLNAINTIQADGNLTPEAKRGAIDNVISTANSTIQWGSTFYNVTLPTIAAPGQTASTVTPGGSASSATTSSATTSKSTSEYSQTGETP